MKNWWKEFIDNGGIFGIIFGALILYFLISALSAEPITEDKPTGCGPGSPSGVFQDTPPDC